MKDNGWREILEECGWAILLAIGLGVIVFAAIYCIAIIQIHT